MVPRKVLFFFSTGHLALKELRPVLMVFHEQGWVVEAWIGQSGQEARAAVEDLRRAGIRADLIPATVGYDVDETPAVGGGGVPPPSARPAWSFREFARAALRPFLVHRLVALGRYFANAMRVRRWAEGLVRASAPDIILINSFLSVGQIDNAVLRAARQSRIPAAGLTNSPYMGELPCLVARLNHLHSGMAGPVIRADFDLVNRLVVRLFPAWTRNLADGSVVFYWDPMLIVAAKFAGLGMNRMWCKPSFDFDKVFIFGKFTRDLLAESGYPEEKLVVAGQPLLDGVIAGLRDPGRKAKIASHIGVQTGAPYLLLNIEPSFEHNYATEETHWRRFHMVMRACTGHGMPVVISLHPLCRPADYQFAEPQYGARISTDIFIHELYPTCAVSVSFPCSTNLLALQFDKPLVVYDFHDLVGRDEQSKRLNFLPGMLVSADEEGLRKHVADAARASRQAGEPVWAESRACAIIHSAVDKLAKAAHPNRG